MVVQDQDGDLRRQMEELRASMQATEARAAKDRSEREAAEARSEIDRSEREAAEARSEKDRSEKVATEVRAAKDRSAREAAEARSEKDRSEKVAALAQAEKERREKEKERHDKELLQQELNPTTLHEYLRNCHNHMYKSLRLADESLRTAGCTSVIDKFYPKELHLWTDFEEVIMPRQFSVIDRICGEAQEFAHEIATVYDGSSIALAPAGNEAAIVTFEKISLEVPVTHIVQFVASHEEFQTKYNTTGMDFSGNLVDLNELGWAVSDTSDSEDSPEDSSHASKRVAREAARKPRTKPDGVGIRTRNKGGKGLAFVYDYKAAHNVDATYVLEAVAKKHLLNEVAQRVNSSRVSTDDDVLARQLAEASIASSLVQVYDYMVTFGVAFGYVAAGQVLLLLYVDRNDPLTLFCHPCMPLELDLADPMDKSEADLAQTVVGQVLCFCLQALESETHPSDRWSSDEAFVGKEPLVNRWPVPYEVQHPEGQESENNLCSQSTDSSGDQPSQSTDGTGDYIDQPSRSTDGSGEFMSTEEAGGHQMSLRLRVAGNKRKGGW